MLSRVLASVFLGSLAKTVSGKGCMLDEISLEMLQNRVPKVSFCAERSLDLNFVNFGGPRSSVGEVLGA